MKKTGFTRIQFLLTTLFLAALVLTAIPQKNLTYTMASNEELAFDEMAMANATCPKCGGAAEYHGRNGMVANYVCYRHQPEYEYTIDFSPKPAEDTSYTPVQYTVTYQEYLTSDKPACTERTVEVNEFAYHTLRSSTVSEYKAKDGTRYVFTGKFNVDGTEYSSSQAVQVNSNITVVPVYEAYYTVTYLGENGKSTFKTFEVKDGEFHKIISEYPEKTGDKYDYEFAGWTFQDAVITGYQVITSNKYFYPSYSKSVKKSVVTYLDADGNTYEAVEVAQGKEFIVPTTGPEKKATSSVGYTFAGWMLNGVKVEGGTLITSEDITLTPIYTEYKIKKNVTPTPTSIEDIDEDEFDEGEEEDDDFEDDDIVAPTAAPTPTEEVKENTDNAAVTGQNDDTAEADDFSDEGKDGESVEEELDLEDGELPMGAVVGIGVGSIAVLAGAGFAIAKATAASKAAGVAVKTAGKAGKAAKAAKTAGKAANAAAEAKAVRDIELEAKTILLAVTDAKLKTELTALFGKKKFLALKSMSSADASEIAGKAEKNKAELVIIDTLDGETAEQFTERANEICPKGSDYKLVAISNDAFTAIPEETFASLKKAGTLAGYTSSDVSDSQKLVKLVLPVFKPEIDAENTAEFIGRVTDALGIPVVSTVIEVVLNGKEIKETLSSKDIDVSDISTVVGNIASIFGIDAVEDVSKLINGIDTAKDVIKTEDVTDAE